MQVKLFDPNQKFEDPNDLELHAYVNFRDEESCILCGNPAGEHHHILYRSHGGKNCANNLATLCHKCHAKIHDKKDNKQELLKQRIKENEERLRERLI